MRSSPCSINKPSQSMQRRLPRPLTEPSITFCNDENEVFKLINHTPERFLERFSGLPCATNPWWKDRIRTVGYSTTAFEIIVTHVLGFSPEQVPVYLGSLSATKSALAKKFASEYITTYNYFTLDTNSLPQTLRPPNTRGERMRVFPAHFRSFPAAFSRTSQNLPHGAQVFAMFLPDADFKELLAKANLKAYPDHVKGAFAYIRFYERNKDIIITEIQSDIYGRIQHRGLSERYKHWSKLLLATFEATIRFRDNNKTVDEVFREMSSELEELQRSSGAGTSDTNDSEFDSAMEAAMPLILSQAKNLGFAEFKAEIDKRRFNLGRIIIPAPAVMRARWHSLVEHDGDTEDRGIAPALAQHIYAELPARLNYDLLPSREPYFQEPHDNGYRVSQLVEWGKPYRNIEDRERSYYSAIIYEHLKPFEEEKDDYHLNAILEDVFPSRFFGDFEMGTGYPQKIPDYVEPKQAALLSTAGVVMAPKLPLSAERIAGIRQTAVEARNKLLLGTDLYDVVDFLTPEHTHFSLGKQAGMQSDYFNLPPISEVPGWHVAALQSSDRNRHPIMRYAFYGLGGALSNFASVGIKGGGAYELHDQDLTYRVDSFDMDHQPIHLGQTRPTSVTSTIANPEIASHRYWGGMTLTEAVVEFSNSIAVLELLSKTTSDAETRIGIPIDVSRLHEVPVIKDGKLKWYNKYDYQMELLEESSIEQEDQLAVYRSVSRADIRVSQLVNSILGVDSEADSNLFVRKAEIDKAMAFLYTVNGSSIDIPDSAIPISDEGVGPRQYVQYLTMLAKHNPHGKAIYQRLEERLISSVAIVHGAGGHFGGAYTEGEGAVGGGATTLRNIDITGALHDIDVDCYIPQTLYGVASTAQMLDKAKQLERYQSSDIFFLVNTLYWLETCLCGRELSDEDQLVEVNLFSEFNKTVIFDSSHRILIGTLPILPHELSAPKPVQKREFTQRLLFDTGTNVDRFLDWSGIELPSRNNPVSDKAQSLLTDEQAAIYKIHFECGRQFKVC